MRRSMRMLIQSCSPRTVAGNELFREWVMDVFRKREEGQSLTTAEEKADLVEFLKSLDQPCNPAPPPIPPGR